MHITSIYRFLTPFSDTKKEEKLLQQIYKKIVRYLKFEFSKLNIHQQQINEFLVVEVQISDVGKFIFYFRTKVNLSQDIAYVLPLFQLDILLEEDFVKKHKKWIIDFLSNIFEMFDGLQEKEYIIDLDPRLCGGFWFFKKCPKYDFQDLQLLQKEFENKGAIEYLQQFLKKYHNDGFVLTPKTANIYLKVHNYLLYLFYLLYNLYKIIYQNESLTNQVERLHTQIPEYRGHLELMKKRLQILGWTSEKVFVNYLALLRKILGLFRG